MKRRNFLTALVMAVGLMVSVAAPTLAAETGRRVVFHIDENDKGRMNLVLNNAQNVNSYYKAKGEKVQIEIVAYGPGLNMLVDGKSPVQARIESMGLGMDNLQFSACGNTHRKMSKKAGKEVKLMSEAKVVPAGVIRLMELQDEGWAYIRP